MTALWSIGELAARTGLPVRTIRFYSDAGVVPEAERSEAGYRLYGPDALARLGLVRALRDLGVDLRTIRRVLEREVSVRDVAAAHAAAIDAQIRVLRGQQAVLQAVARRERDPQELQTMHRLAQLSDDERRRIIDDFLDHIFDGLDVDPAFVARMRSAQPALPDDPSPEQVDAWIELAELVQDAGLPRAHPRDVGGGRRAGAAGRATCVPSRSAPALRRLAASSRGRRRPRRSWRRCCPSSGRPTVRRSPTGSRPAPTRGRSATGSCWR